MKNRKSLKIEGIDVYSIDDLDFVYEKFLSNLEWKSTLKNKNAVQYVNAPFAFDIETSSFYQNDMKHACMYEWTIGFNGAIIIGRTWEEFLHLYKWIVEKFDLSVNKRIVFYVHNLAFEFQWIRKRLEWNSVFSKEERRPMYALTKDGVEFRCSYFLSGYSLEDVGNQLKKYPVKKMVGDLDYSLLRNSETPLTEKELGYCVGDVRVVMNYIREKIEKDGDITKIPLTKTSYIRRYCRNNCLYEGSSHKQNGWKFVQYRKLMKSLQLTPEEYTQLKRAFQGGFTHANMFSANKTLKDVASFDFTSSYPAVMISEKFPMGRGHICNIDKDDDNFRKNINCYCCVFDVEFIDLEACTLIDHPLSFSRCWDTRNPVTDNGRVVTADHLKTTLTNEDFFIMEKFYKWNKDKMVISNFRRYRKGYLPTNFIKSILKLYKDKTELKGVSGKEEQYLNSKEMLNSCYGMCVTDICMDNVIYAGDQWGVEKGNVSSEIEKYNKSVQRFLFYPWGVWVTAYARRNLFSGIYEFGEDYVYSDTDSIKCLNYKDHMEYIERYNKAIIEKLEKALKFHGIDVSEIKPKTINGVEKPLGVWDFEGVSTRFKTLGAKRYLTEKDGKISLTVSGVRKTTAVPYLVEKYGDKVFDAFTSGLEIPPKNDLGKPLYTEKDHVEIKNPCGKNTHTYLDDAMSGYLTDYLGNTAYYEELSGVHLEPAGYSLDADKYIDYILGVREKSK